MKTYIKPRIVTNDQELKQALDAAATVIYIEKPLYSAIVAKVKKSNTAKIVGNSGVLASLAGLLVVGGPIGWAMLLGGATVAALGNSMDSLKNYSAEIDEVSCRITLLRTTGKNRYKSSKHEISNRK